MSQPLVSVLIFAGLIASYAHSGEITPRIIYGDDDRLDYYQAPTAERKRAESTVALLRAADLNPHGAQTSINTTPYGQSQGLCSDEPFYNQEKAAFCSGFLVAPDLIVTAGHCIRNEETCQQTRFVFGFYLGDAADQPRSVPTAHVFTCQKLIHSVSDPKGEDFAIVRLDRAVTHVAPLSFRQQGSPLVGDALEVMGHPFGLPLKIAGGAHIRSLADQFFIANLDTYGGNSGSAVFNSLTGVVEGVLVRGGLDFIYKDGCRTSNRCGNDECRGEDVTMFKQILPFLKGN